MVALYSISLGPIPRIRILRLLLLLIRHQIIFGSHCIDDSPSIVGRMVFPFISLTVPVVGDVVGCLPVGNDWLVVSRRGSGRMPSSSRESGPLCPYWRVGVRRDRGDLSRIAGPVIRRRGGEISSAGDSVPHCRYFRIGRRVDCGSRGRGVIPTVGGRVARSILWGCGFEHAHIVDVCKIGVN
jgi:hypothetical protein